MQAIVEYWNTKEMAISMSEVNKDEIGEIVLQNFEITHPGVISIIRIIDKNTLEDVILVNVWGKDPDKH